MQEAERLASLPPYIFARLGARLRKLMSEGHDIIRLDIGSPDLPPAPFIIEALARSAQDPHHHGYAGYVGLPSLRQAIADYYRQRFGVALSWQKEILPLIGSKEGLANIALAFINPGDLVLVPDPGYPTYRMGTFLAQGDVYYMPLLAENDFLPDLEAIPADVAQRAKMMWLSYPNNPTGAIADESFFARVVEFARRYDILVCHDAPYCEVGYDGYRAPSFLAVPGAREVGIEFNSLSKSHNMAGWRVGMLVGREDVVQSLLKIKSNIDSGIFWPIQDAATVALRGDQSWLEGRNAIYQERRDMILATLAEMGIRARKPQASLYVWAEVPAGYTSQTFADKVLLEGGVSITPGSAFGAHGEGFVRISVGMDTEKVREALVRLKGLSF